MMKKILISAAFLFGVVKYSFASNNNFFGREDEKISPRNSQVMRLDKLPKPVIGLIMENMDIGSFGRFSCTSKFFNQQTKDYFKGLTDDGSSFEHVKNFLLTVKDAFRILNETQSRTYIKAESFYKIFENKTVDNINFKFLLETAVRLPFSNEKRGTPVRRFESMLVNSGFYDSVFNAPTQDFSTLCQFGINSIMLPIVFNAFLKNKTDIINSVFYNGYTPLGYMVSFGKNISNIEFLLENKADPNLVDESPFYPSTPPEYALLRPSESGEDEEITREIVDLLLKYGAVLQDEQQMNNLKKDKKN